MCLIVVDEEAQEQVAALPTGLLPHYAEDQQQVEVLRVYWL